MLTIGCIGLTKIREVKETEYEQTADKQWKRSVSNLDLNEEEESNERYQTQATIVKPLDSEKNGSQVLVLGVTMLKFIVDGVEYVESEALSNERRLFRVNLSNNLVISNMRFAEKNNFQQEFK